MRVNMRLHIGVLLALLIGVIVPIAAVTPANATPACNPTYTLVSYSSNQARNYQFKDIGTCIWTVPAGMYVERIVVVGGGGGGGGGAHHGAITGGGGGGGGGGGLRYLKTYNYLTRGNTYSITVGAGGTAGAGAVGANATNGGDGGESKFGSFTVTGGRGGVGGSYDAGGAGGVSGEASTSALGGSGNNGGAAYNGNGGGGATSSGSTAGNAAYDLAAGTSAYGHSINTSWLELPAGFRFGGGGGGGASAGYASPGGGGRSAAAAATPTVNSGSGGGGGHGCPTADSSCSNINGSAGADGMVIVQLSWSLSNANSTGDIWLNVGQYTSFKPMEAPAAIGTGSWQMLNTATRPLPNGLTFNATTGVISGTPTASQGSLGYFFQFSDSGNSQMPLNGTFNIGVVSGDSPLTLSNMTLEYGQAYRIPIENLKSTYSKSISSSNLVLCPKSGTNGETITAAASSGSCLITVIQTGDSNYRSFYKDFIITLAKATTTTTLTSSPTSPQVTGTPITLTATTTSGATGNVSFYFGDTVISSCGSGTGVVALSAGTATCTWTPTSASGSPFALKAKYLGNSNYSSSTSAAIDYVIHPPISLAYSGSTSTYLSGATITPEISGGTGSVTSWSWSVKKASDNSSVSGISINSSGVITVSSSLAAGTYNMNVTATDTVGISKTVSVNIYISPSTPTVAMSSPSKSILTSGQSVNLSATLPGGASGTVTFKYGATTITGCGSAGAVTISAGIASCVWNTSGITAATYLVTAEFSGGGSYTAATSNPVSITINNKSVFTYSNQSTDYAVATTLTPVITSNTGTGISTTWNWSVVKHSDSSTVSGISVDNAGIISVSNTTSAGTYGLRVSAVDSAGDTSTALVTMTVNKARPVLTVSPRITSGALVSEATVNRSIYFKIETTHRASGTISLYRNGTLDTNCFTSVQYMDGQCWWTPSVANETQTVYAVYGGNDNLESATSNVITNFPVNAALSLSYSDTSTYGGFETSLTPTYSGGSGTRVFSMFQYFTGVQIPGISIDSTTGVITVDRSTQVDTYRMTVMISDQTNATAVDDNVGITVSEQLSPSITVTSATQSITKGSAINSVRVLHSSTPATKYSISPDLPSGLLFSATTGAISGSPEAAQTSTTYTITASNNAGTTTATFVLTVSENLVATISIALGTNPAAKGVANTIIATISAAGKVQFYAQGKRIPGCISLSGTSSVTCNWKPALIGNQSLTARLFPTNSAIANVSSAPLTVGVGRRTGRR